MDYTAKAARRQICRGKKGEMIGRHLGIMITVGLLLTGSAAVLLRATAPGTPVAATEKILAAWDSIQMRIHAQDEWRDYRFGRLEVTASALVHNGKQVTTIAWARMGDPRLHPLANRILIPLKDPREKMELETMLSWSRSDFEMLHRDLARFITELSPAVVEKGTQAADGGDEPPSENENNNGG